MCDSIYDPCSSLDPIDFESSALGLGWMSFKTASNLSQTSMEGQLNAKSSLCHDHVNIFLFLSLILCLNSGLVKSGINTHTYSGFLANVWAVNTHN